MNWSEKYCVVTGGGGFIGSALVWELNQRGCENIIIVDRFGTDEKWKNLVPLRYLDVVDVDGLWDYPIGQDDLGVDYIFHMGACSATTEKDADYLLENNYRYTCRLAEWSQDIEAKFIYASSAATYGDGANGMLDDAVELEKLRPLNMYGYSKHMFDLYAKRNEFLDQMIGLKFFNIFGPNENHKGDMRSVVHKAFGQIRREGVLKLFRSYHPDYRDGEQMRDFLYVKDAVKMVLHLAENKSAGGLYNIGSGEANTWLALANAVFKALDIPSNIEFIEMPESIRDKYQYYTKADISRLRETGYDKPISSLDASIADYVQNYLIRDCYLGD